MPNRKKQKMNKDEKERRKKMSHSQKPMAAKTHCIDYNKTDWPDMRRMSHNQFRLYWKNLHALNI